MPTTQQTAANQAVWIGARLATRRRSKRLNRAKFVALLGWPPTRHSVERLATIENGETEPDLQTLKLMAAALNCQVAALLYRLKFHLITEDTTCTR